MGEIYTFTLSQKVRICDGSESGVIIARAEYREGPPMYLVRYVAGDGRAVESWWSQSALSAI